jgi:succinoglycan biosynthesis protein ExoM
MARGTLVAMIDDDELPGDDWLLQLLRTLVARRADGVLGPVRPLFEAPPPQWILRERLLRTPEPTPRARF